MAIRDSAKTRKRATEAEYTTFILTKRYSMQGMDHLVCPRESLKRHTSYPGGEFLKSRLLVDSVNIAKGDADLLDRGVGGDRFDDRGHCVFARFCGLF